MTPFKGVDYFLLDEMYSDEEKAVRQMVRDFVSERIMPTIGDFADRAVFPRELVPEFGRLGLLGANLTGYECAGLNNVAYGLILQELERGDSGIRSFVSVQGALVMYPIHAFGSEEQKKKWLPSLARGEKIGCFGLTEPDFGSNPSGMRTRARLDGNSWVLNGAKMWITNGTISDVAVVWARTDEGIRGFIVEKGTKGFSTKETKRKFSLRASDTSELVFEDCRIPKENLLPGSNGLRSALACLTQARYGIAWGAMGAAMACYDEALNYAKSRIVFDKPIAGFQLVQEKLVEMVTEITKGQMLAYRLGRLKDEGRATFEMVSMAKRNNVSWALRIARTARDILGANGVTFEYQSGRHLCNLESVITYEGTHDIHTLIIGADVTGLPAFK